MKVLISPVSLQEAVLVAEGGADIVDIKNINEGSLGASFPWIISEVAKGLISHNIVISATLGDLPFKPGTASLAALGAVVSGARYVKAGLFDIADENQGVEMMTAIKQACKSYCTETLVVTAGYADYRRFDGLSPSRLVDIAKKSGSDLVMIDTAVKDGKSLFEVLSYQEINEFVSKAHSNDLQVALAGSLALKHLPLLQQIAPDVIGVRGAVCDDNDRRVGIQAERVKSFVESARNKDSTRSSVSAKV